MSEKNPRKKPYPVGDIKGDVIECIWCGKEQNGSAAYSAERLREKGRLYVFCTNGQGPSSCATNYARECGPNALDGQLTVATIDDITSAIEKVKKEGAERECIPL